MAKRQVVLVILDGWGIGQKNESNPIYIQGTPNIDYIKEVFLIGALQASGISVGLPWNEEGNSEVGHLTIGAGKEFAEFGDWEENGNWPPHLHFQIILDIAQEQSDYPGVCRFSERGQWLANSPDPMIILSNNFF